MFLPDTPFTSKECLLYLYDPHHLHFTRFGERSEGENIQNARMRGGRRRFLPPSSLFLPFPSFLPSRIDLFPSMDHGGWMLFLSALLYFRHALHSAESQTVKSNKWRDRRAVFNSVTSLIPREWRFKIQFFLCLARIRRNLNHTSLEIAVSPLL